MKPFPFVLVTFLLWKHTKTKVTYRRLLEAYCFRGIINGPWRQNGGSRWQEARAAAESSYLPPHRRDERTGNGTSLLKLQALPQRHTPSNKATPLSFPNSSANWGQVFKHGSIRAILIQPLHHLLMHCLRWLLFCNSRLARVYETSWLTNIWKYLLSVPLQKKIYQSQIILWTFWGKHC